MSNQCMDPSAFSSSLLQPEDHETASGPSGLSRPQNNRNASLRTQISRQEWDQLKPLIRQLYIEENKTLSYISSALATSNKFRPTKKQFTNKITEWGFKKNIKQSEREGILQNLGPLEGDIRIDLGGRKFQRKRLLRWDKEKRKESMGSYLSKSSPPEEQKAEHEGDPISEPGPISPATLQTHSTSSSVDVESNRSSSSHGGERRVWVREGEDMEYELVPRAHWMSADVLNSPSLSRLLQGLAIETKDLSDDIEPLSISDPYFEPNDTSAIEPILWSDFSASKPDASTTQQIDGFSDLVHFASENRPPPQHFGRHSTKRLKYPGVDVLLPTGIPIRRSPSPLNEIYPFPPPIANPQSKPIYTLSLSRQNMASRLLDQLKRLEVSGVKGRHPGVLALTNRLADVAYESGNMSQANNLYRKVLAAQHGDIDTWPEKALHAQAALIDGLCREGHPLEAKEILEGVSTAMTRRYDPTHVIFRRLQKARIEIFNWMEDWDREEPVTRDLVQICLTLLGSRDPETLNAMYRLASVMMGKGRYSEAERLHKMTIQLCQEGTEKHHERRCWSSTGLGRVYEAQGRLDEAIEVLQQAFETAKKTLGGENEAVMIQGYRLARILAKKGLLEESEELLFETMTLQTKVLGETHINPMCTMFELGGTLLQQKKYEESAFWLEKCFHTSLTLSNFEFITRFCKGLGTCYEEQQRYTEALSFYYEAIAFLQAAKEKSTDDIFDVQQYMARINGLIDNALQHTDVTTAFPHS